MYKAMLDTLNSGIDNILKYYNFNGSYKILYPNGDEPFEFFASDYNKFNQFFNPLTKGAEYKLVQVDENGDVIADGITVTGENFYFFENNRFANFNRNPLINNTVNMIKMDEVDSYIKSLELIYGSDYANTVRYNLENFAGTKYMFPYLVEGVFKLEQTKKPEETDFSKYGFTPLPEDRIFGKFIDKTNDIYVEVLVNRDEYGSIISKSIQFFEIIDGKRVYNNLPYENEENINNILPEDLEDFTLCTPIPIPVDYYQSIAEYIPRFSTRQTGTTIAAGSWGASMYASSNYIGLFQPRAVSDNLTIIKDVPNGDYGDEFTFILELEDQCGNRIDGTVEYEVTNPDGSKTIFTIENREEFKLSKGQSITLINLPYGTKYKITELPIEGYITEDNVIEGTILPEENIAKFTNIRVGDLLISKEVIGGSDDEEFTFRLTLTDKNGVELKDAFEYIKYHLDELISQGFIRSGETFELQNGQTIRIKNIPFTTKYVVEELTPKGYKVVAENNVGEISADETIVKFTNTKVPDTPPEEPPYEPPYTPPVTPPDTPEIPERPPEVPVIPEKPEELPPEIPENPVEQPPEVPHIPEKPVKVPPKTPPTVQRSYVSKTIPRTGWTGQDLNILYILGGLYIMTLKKKKK